MSLRAYSVTYTFTFDVTPPGCSDREESEEVDSGRGRSTEGSTTYLE